MAASIRLSHATGFFSKYSRRTLSLSSLRSYNTEKNHDALNFEDKPQYPTVKPRYPPGKWGEQFLERIAWQFHDEGESLKGIPKVKERLESMAGTENMGLTICTPDDFQPDTMLYKQYVTKTHIEEGLPETHKHINVTSDANLVMSKVTDAILVKHEHNQYHPKRKSESRNQMILSTNFVGNLISAITSSLSLHHEHLLSSQIDENVRVETFWRRSGYLDAEGKNLHATRVWRGLITLQFKEIARWQMRTELPLPQFVDRDDDISKGPSVDCHYLPSCFGQSAISGKKTNISGHWIGDPCEWGQVSFYTPSKYHRFVAEYGEDEMEKYLRQVAMTSGFGACASQAYNQGFSYLNDLTYPITTHTIAFDPYNNFYICAYQLNTLQLFKEDTSNPYRNLAWISGPHKLYDTVEQGKVKGFNEKTFNLLLKCFLMKPGDRGIDLRPYLQEEESPLHTKQWINMKGEEPIEKPKIGRFQYPRNAVYF